jgi:hypothetical protein
MANQVLVVAILMIVQGVLECLMGLFLVVMAFVVPSLFEAAQKQQQAAGGPAAPPGLPPGFEGLLTGTYLTMGVCGLIAGIPHIIAGIRNISYRGRTFGLVALFLSVFSFATCYCAPTSLGVMIYGLIVYFNQETARAFELGEQGLSREEVRRTLEREREGGPWLGPPGGERDRGGEPEPPRLPPPTSPDPRFRGDEPAGPRQPPEA